MKKTLLIIIISILLALIAVVALLWVFNRTNNDLKGEVIEFGSYEDGWEEDTTYPQLWEVVENDSDTVYLVTENVVDCIPFMSQDQAFEVSWRDSYIRKWLNNDFYNRTFTEDEKDMILTVDLELLNHSRYENGRETEYSKDKVFLMTAEQAESLSKDMLRAEVNIGADMEGDISCSPVGSFAMWWLMSPGYYNWSSAYVDFYGNIHNGSMSDSNLKDLINADSDFIGVRPMIAMERDCFERIQRSDGYKG